jgi:hypothetical protein
MALLRANDLRPFHKYFYFYFVYFFKNRDTEKQNNKTGRALDCASVYIHERVTCIARSAGAVDQQFLRLAILLHSITFLPEL